MANLVLATYAGDGYADHVLGILRAPEVTLPGTFDSSATVRVTPDATYKVAHRERQGSSDALWGVLWEALFGLILRVPLSGTSYGSTLGGLFGAIDRAGLDAEFRSSVRKSLSPPSSGLAVIASGWDPEPLLRHFVVRPRAIFSATIDLEPGSELNLELGRRPPQLHA
jgi:uncharacterized membrane protein